ENIRSLINIGTATSKRIRLIQHAPETSERLKSLGFDIYHAQLYLQLEELNLLLEKEDSVEYRILAAKHTKKLSDLTTEAEQTLNKCFDGAEVRKLQLGIFAEDINEILKRYGRALSDFQAFMSALYIQQQLKSSKDSEKLLLERDRFAVHRRYETATKFYLDHSGCVRRAKGELIDTRDKPPQELHLLLERHDYEEESHAEEEEENNCSDTRLPVKKLAKILRAFNPQADGVLECLGYRTQPTIDLVFRIPDEMSEHGLENLQNLIANNNHGCGITTIPSHLGLFDEVNMDTLISAVQTSAMVALIIIAIVTLAATTWIIGVKLAEPFGVMLSNTINGVGDALVDTEASNVEERSGKMSRQESRRNLGRIFSGIIAMFLCVFCVTFEQESAKHDFRPPGLWWNLCVPVLKGIFEAFVALGMLRLALTAVRRLVAN
ncbi:hypothetical protein KCU89_g1687, partial [Aureobasidium melanogenum]